LDEIQVKLDYPDLIKASVSDDFLVGSLGPQSVVKVISNVSAGGTITNITQLGGLDISSAQDGDILVYESTTQLWEAVDELDGGEY
jgi:hypothetical protein